MGKVASPPRSRAGRSSQMAGNGTCAASRMEIDYVPIRLPVSGANWRRTNHMRTSKRTWGGPSPPRTGVAPAFRRNVADWGDATGVEGARRRRADRGAGPEVRICSISSHKGAFSGPPIGTWSVSRQPAPIGNGTGGPEARSPRLAHALMAGPWLAPRLAAGPLVRTPLGGRTPGSNPAYWIPDRGKSGASGNYPAY